MRKIIRYSSLEWDEKLWDKKITWEDPDFPSWRGAKKDHKDVDYPRAIADDHIMFALVSKITPARIILVPIESEKEPRQINMNAGGVVLIGNGFVYYDTRLGDIKL